MNGLGDCVSRQENKIIIRGSWLVPVERTSVYAIASDFAKMPENFPKLARSLTVTKTDGNRLTLEVETTANGILFPSCTIGMEVELLPEHGYRCKTLNRNLNTTGEEELLLRDTTDGTLLDYTYVVTVKHKWLCPLFGWLVRRFALGYWKKQYLTPLTVLAQQHQHRSSADKLAR